MADMFVLLVWFFHCPNYFQSSCEQDIPVLGPLRDGRKSEKNFVPKLGYAIDT